MNYFRSLKKSALIGTFSFAFIAIAGSSAIAMPVGSDVGMASGKPLLQWAEFGQHRVYPGSDSAAAQQARETHNAPNRFCEKQPGKCE